MQILPKIRKDGNFFPKCESPEVKSRFLREEEEDELNMKTQTRAIENTDKQIQKVRIESASILIPAFTMF